MSAIEDQRATLVDVLWKLKQALAKDESDLYVQFSMMLNDSGYRISIIEKALRSPHHKVKVLAHEASILNMDGALVAPPGHHAAAESSAKESTRPQAPAPSGATVGTKLRLHSALGYTLTTLALVLSVGLVGFLFGDNVRALLGGKELVSGSIYSDTRWTSDRTYVLEDIVFVEPGAKLTIEPGTRIVGEAGSALVVTRDAVLYARGRADAPVVFTSSRPEGTRQPGDWGGVVLLGNAPINRGTAHIEGIDSNDPRGGFGGSSLAHSCGVLEYVRIEFAGYEIGANNELNGLTLGGCGAGTIVRHVQVHRGTDDGIEVFGGNVDIQYAVVSGAGDDAFDWDMGWTGRVQFLVVQQYPGIGDNGFEGDNWKSQPDAQPRSSPTFYNVTMVGSMSPGEDQRAMTIRRGSGGTFRNFIVSGFPLESIDLVGPEISDLLSRSELSFGGFVFHAIGRDGKSWFADETVSDDDGGVKEEAIFRNPLVRARLGSDPMLPAAAYDLSMPNFTPDPASPARSGAFPVPSVSASSPLNTSSGTRRPIFWERFAPVRSGVGWRGGRRSL